MLGVDVLQRLQVELGAPRDAGADEALGREGRRSRGAYFTPMPLVRLIAAEAVRARLEAGPAVRRRDDGSPELVVLDPACGDARFLAAAADELVRRTGTARELVVRRCLVGIERDPAFAAEARRRLGVGAVVYCREALVDPPALPPADVVLGNPPYVRSIHLAEGDPALWRALKGRYAATSHGEWDLYAAFLEQSLYWAAPGVGQVGFVVPSRWLTAVYAARLRGKLARSGAVRAVVDFGQMQIFAGATTYASVVFLSRRRVDAVSVLRCGEGERGWDAGEVSVASLSEKPWRLSVGARRGMLERLAGSPVLGDVARIVKGAGTNADRVYVLEPVRDEGAVVRARSPELGAEVDVEREIVRPVYRGRDVGAEGTLRLCVVPYGEDGRLFDPDEMRARFPRALAYLERCRERLDARERGRFRGETFYRFGRPQNLAFFADPAPKVVVPDVAREGRAVLDTTGAFVLDTAYAVRLRDGANAYSLELIAAVLASPFVRLWLRETGVPLRGGYVRMKTAYLESMPLPPAGTDVRELREAYGVSADEWRRIG